MNFGHIAKLPAIAELKDYKIKHNRLPAIKTKRWKLIREAINCGEWISFGVGTWNDLIITVKKIESISDKRKTACRAYFQKCNL